MKQPVRSYTLIPNRCVQCGKKFSARTNKDGTVQRFCSKRCARIFDHPQRVSSLVENSGRKPGRTIVEKTCEYCGAKFQVFKGDIQRYCDRPCQHKQMRRWAMARISSVIDSGVKRCLHCLCEMPIRCFPSMGSSRNGLDAHSPTCRACGWIRRKHSVWPVIMNRTGKLHLPELPTFSDSDKCLKEILDRYWRPILE